MAGPLYFAYGSNMSVRDMRARCPGGRLCGTAALEGFRFQINRHGYATVVPRRGGTVFGALWRLTPRDLRALDAYEGVDEGYYVKDRLDVRLPEGGTACAVIYVATNASPGTPRRGYIRDIIEAARRLRFPAPYMRELAGWQPRGPGS
jgi:gamma-glutamylcyclotransferase (GGCT)/AIG2-like uncharacterized protein YtfP